MTRPTKEEALVVLQESAQPQIVRAIYKNHRGETAERRFLPLSLEWTTCQCHGDEPSWVCHAWDYDKQDVRSFSLIHFMSPWRPFLGATGAAAYFTAPQKET